MTRTPEEKQQGQYPDRAVCNKEEDRHGFTHIATELAHAIQGIGREGSAVAGTGGPRRASGTCSAVTKPCCHRPSAWAGDCRRLQTRDHRHPQQHRNAGTERGQGCHRADQSTMGDSGNRRLRTEILGP